MKMYQRNLPTVILTAVTLLTGLGHEILRAVDWENPLVFERNQEEPHVPLIPYETVQKAVLDNRLECPYFLSLDGNWKFEWAPVLQKSSLEFYKLDFDPGEWDVIEVPGCWQLSGYGHPMFRNVSQTFYSDPPFVPDDYNPVGSYRRQFTIPEKWQNRQVFLHFEGIKSASYVWINGEEVGYNQGGMEPAEYDITPFIHSGNNIIAVRVFRYCDGTYLEDQDMWRLSGIYRSVYLFATPPVHIRDFFVVTDLDNDYRDAELRIRTEIKNYWDSGGACIRIRGWLADFEEPSARMQSQMIQLDPLETRIVELSTKVRNPAKWSAEQPNLYTLLLELQDEDNNNLEVLSGRIGFRKVEIENQGVLINGVPVKFNGVNSHVHHPVTGRTMSVDVMKKDLILMKRFNINCVRTSHYPPNREYLDLADELGIYIVDEVGDEAHSNRQVSYDPVWRNAYLDRCRKMVKRDRNHPSVVIWSAGNESGSGPNIGALIELGKSLDPSRPGWLYGGNDGRLVFEDIIGPRYPDPYELKVIGQEPVDIDSRPSFMDEYAAATGNSLGSLDEFWDVIYNSRRLTGGAVWDWVSPGILRPLILTPDKSPKKNHGVMMGRARLGSGRYGKALDLSGRDEWVEIYRDPSLDIAGEELTLEAWVFPRDWHGTNPFITKGNHQYALQQFTRDSLEFFIYDNEPVTVHAVLPDDWYFSWHHIAGVYDGNELVLFIDGVPAATKPYKGRIQNDHFPVNVGKNNEIHGQDYPGQLSNAKMDNVRIFARALDVGELGINENFSTKAPQGAVLWLDFEECEQKGEFCTLGIGGRAYGLVWGDRTVQPELWQLKKSPQPVKVEPLDLLSGKVRIANRYFFTDLRDLSATWKLQADGGIQQSGRLPVNLAPGQQDIYTIPYRLPDPVPGVEYRLLFEFALSEDRPWAEKGHVVAWEQFDIPLPRGVTTDIRIEDSSELFVKEMADALSVSGRDFRYEFDKNRGTMTSMVFRGTEMLSSGPRLDIWRAPLNNETDPWGTQISLQWRKAGLNRLESRVESVAIDMIDKNIVRIAVSTVEQASGASARIANDFIYYVLATGDVILNHRVLPIGDMPEWLARIGIHITVPPEFEQLCWYGRGPIETYPDRKTGAQIGVYTADVYEQFTPYLVPQDCCNKSDVRWIALSDKRGTGLFISGGEPLDVSVYPVTTENLSRALYPFQLKTGETITVNIDHRVSGVGGTPVSTLPKYRVLPQEYIYALRLRPFDLKVNNPADLGRQTIPRYLTVFP